MAATILLYLFLCVCDLVAAVNSTSTNWNQVNIFGSEFEQGHLFDGVPTNFYESLPNVNKTAMDMFGHSAGVIANLTGIRELFAKKGIENSQDLKKRDIRDDRVSSNEMAFMDLFDASHVLLPNNTVVHTSNVTIIDEPMVLKKRVDCDNGMWRNFANTKWDWVKNKLHAMSQQLLGVWFRS